MNEWTSVPNRDILNRGELKMPDPESMLWNKKDNKGPPVPLIILIIAVVLGLAIWAIVGMAGQSSPAPVPAVEAPVPAPKTVTAPVAAPVKTAEWTLDKLREVVAANTPIYFVKDSIKLLPGEMKKVETMVEAMKNYKNIMLNFRGHTADVNTKARQVALAKARANRILWAFEYREGWNIIATEKVGLGSKELVSKGNTEAQRAPNRRVEVIVQAAEAAK